MCVCVCGGKFNHACICFVFSHKYSFFSLSLFWEYGLNNVWLSFHFKYTFNLSLWTPSLSLSTLFLASCEVGTLWLFWAINLYWRLLAHYYYAHRRDKRLKGEKHMSLKHLRQEQARVQVDPDRGRQWNGGQAEARELCEATLNYWPERSRKLGDF